MAYTAPKRKVRDPNDIFASLDRPVISPIASATKHNAPIHSAPILPPPPILSSSPQKSTTSSPSVSTAKYGTNAIRYTKPQIVTSRRVLSISKRFMGTTGSLLRRTGSPPRGRRTPPPSRRTSVRKTSGGRGLAKGGIKPPLDLGPQHSPYDTVNVRERVRKWQFEGGGVIEADTNPYVPPPPIPASQEQQQAPRSSSRNPEKRRTMLADYTVNDSNFDELETSSARWGLEPLALPAPPALSGYGSNAGSRKGSRPGSVASNRDIGEWEDAVSGAEMSGREDKSAWNSAPEDAAAKLTRKKTKKKRVPREGVDVEAMRAKRERRKKKLMAVSGHESGKETDADHRRRSFGAARRQGREEEEETEIATTVDIPGAELESREDLAVVPMAAIDDAPPLPPPHVGSMPAILNSKPSTKSLDDDTPSTLKSIEDTPASVLSDPGRESTPLSSTLDDDGIRVVPLRRKFTKAEKHERHKQRQAEREEMMEREKTRIREEERLRYQEMERAREAERQKEIERIKEEERQLVLEEERQREEERRTIRELDLKAHREKEEQKKREREKEERRRQRELIREQERAREIERIREEEKLKVIEELRVEQERERERLEFERERLRVEEQRRAAREEQRHQEIMSEIERATQRSTTRAKKKKKDAETVLAEEVQKRVGPDALRSKEEMAASIKATVLEVMNEMFGEIIYEDETKPKDPPAHDQSIVSSSILTDDTSAEMEESEHRTRETTPEVEKKSPLPAKKSFASPVDKSTLPPKRVFHLPEKNPHEQKKSFPSVVVKGLLQQKKSFPVMEKKILHQKNSAPAMDKNPVQSRKNFATVEDCPPSPPARTDNAPVLPAHNDITFRVADFKPAVVMVEPEPVREPIREPSREKIREPIREPSREKVHEPTREPSREKIREPTREPSREKIQELPREPSREQTREQIREPVPEPTPEETPADPPSSPETPTKTSIFSIPKRRINLFGSQNAKRRRKPFAATIPEESSSQLSVESEPTSPPSGHRVFSFAPRTAAEPISPPVTRHPSSASQSAGQPVRQFSIASRSSHHTDYSDHSVATTSQIHRNLPNDDNLNLPGQNMKSGLTRSLTSPAAHTNLAKDEDPGDEYFVSVHEPLRGGSGIKRYKSTADLMSILSERHPSSVRAKSIKSTRSIRSIKNKVVVGTLTLKDLLIELATEEFSYTEDLQLLEHRIVPVLLDAKLAKTDQEAAAGKRASPEKLIQNNPLKAIVDVSIALKRLNGIHEKLADAIKIATPDDAEAVPEPEEILKWAQASKYVYEDYIAFWKMDWDEVVINTDVLEAIEKKKAGGNGSVGSASEVLAGTGKNGKSIDVGYLLKRPLVRTRVLTKLFKVSEFNFLYQTRHR
ncbi:hypothetical protein ABW20_dc0106761 [Dactylellina cionopaga]|nr:hypothetical protein ABW20_dc0106761 [Dactylellina cionopaga]